MHLRVPPFSSSVGATMAQAMDIVDAADAVDAVDMSEAKESKTATNISASIAILNDTLQMHAERGNMLRRKESTMSEFLFSTGYQAVSKSVVFPTKVYSSGGL